MRSADLDGPGCRRHLETAVPACSTRTIAKRGPTSPVDGVCAGAVWLIRRRGNLVGSVVAALVAARLENGLRIRDLRNRVSALSAQSGKQRSHFQILIVQITSELLQKAHSQQKG